MGQQNKELSEMRQYFERMSRNSDKYFKRFDKLLPSNLTSNDTVLLYKIDNIGCMMKIIERNPNARYTVFGNKFVNDALKILNVPSIVEYRNSTKKFEDKKNIDYTAFTYSCFEWHPDSIKPVDYFKIGLKKDDKISIISKDGNHVYEELYIYDNRNVVDCHRKIAKFTFFIKKIINENHKPMSSFLKRGLIGAACFEQSYAMINDSDYSVKDFHDKYIASLCVVKN